VHDSRGIEIVNFTISLALSAGTLMASAGTPYRLVPAHFYPWMYGMSLYGLECFQLGKANRHSLDFTFNRLCMKLFKTGSIDVVKDRQSYFAIDLPSCDLKRRQDKFTLRYSSTVNGFCQFCNKL